MTLISVIMAVHNGERYLNEAVDSVLAQQGTEFEFIIIDDGSSDGTGDVLARLTDPRVVLHRNERNMGLTASLNVGLGMARGEFVARMDADDVSLPDRLKTQCAALQRQDAQVCFCRARLRDEPNGKDVLWREMPWPLVRWRGLFDNFYGPHPAVMFRRRDTMDAGGYDESFRRAQDYDLWDRCLAKGFKFIYVPETLLQYRSHPESITRLHGQEQSAVAMKVSFRAMARAFPDAPRDELVGLRWLMLGRVPIPEEPQIEAALQKCLERVGGFSAPSVWKDMATRLSRRLKDLHGKGRALAVRRMLDASLRSRSPRSLIRSVFSTVFPSS